MVDGQTDGRRLGSPAYKDEAVKKLVWKIGYVNNHLFTFLFSCKLSAVIAHELVHPPSSSIACSSYSEEEVEGLG